VTRSAASAVKGPSQRERNPLQGIRVRSQIYTAIFPAQAGRASGLPRKIPDRFRFMPTCSGCGAEKDEDDFQFRNVALAIRKRRCRDCCSSYGKDWYGRNAASHKVNVVANNKRYVQRNYRLVREARLRCSRCGESDPACLDLHHRDPRTKDRTLARAVQLKWSPAKLRAEIEKCDVLCANCHRKLHARERSQRESDPRPAVLGTAALPLSYASWCALPRSCEVGRLLRAIAATDRALPGPSYAGSPMRSRVCSFLIASRALRNSSRLG
jgi:hypothetical protein